MANDPKTAAHATTVAEYVRAKGEGGAWRTSNRMPATTLDLRDVPPPERHPKIHDAFTELDSGESLRIVNDHEPKPLFYEFQAEVEDFDAENYAFERRDDEEFVADLPKV